MPADFQRKSYKRHERALAHCAFGQIFANSIFRYLCSIHLGGAGGSGVVGAVAVPAITTAGPPGDEARVAIHARAIRALAGE